MANLKRVWDTTKKQILWGENSLGKMCQIWTDGENFFVYNDTTKERENFDNPATYGPVWTELNEEDNLGVYDTNVPTNFGTPEDTFVATYTFLDYDEETELGSGTVSDYGTPTAPENPTREGYTFTGRDPEVGPITKNTTYIAQYEEDAGE